MAIPTSTRPPVLPNEQKSMGPPVVHAPGLPAMEEVGGVKTVLRNIALPLMAADAAAAVVRGEHLMDKAGGMSEVPPSHGLGPQRPKEGEGQNMPAPSDGYLRLEVHFPKAHVTAENLQKVDIVLHNVREAPDRLAPTLAMHQQPGVEAVEVARLSGVKLESVPTVVRSQLERIINENKIAP